MKKTIIAMFLAVALLAAGAPAMASNQGQITEMEGSVTITKANGQRATGMLGSVVNQGDVIETGVASRATILFDDGSVLRMGPDTTLEIKKLAYDQEKGVVESAYDLAQGTLMSIVGSLFGNEGSSYEVSTPTAVAGVRGTTFILKVGVRPATGEMSTMGVGVDGTVNFAGKSGGQFDLGPDKYSIAGADGVAGQPLPTDPNYIDELLDGFRLENPSMGSRAQDMRNGPGKNAPKSNKGVFLPRDIKGGGPGGSVDDIKDKEDMMGMDNPAEVIFQEPPGAAGTPVRVTIQLP